MKVLTINGEVLSIISDNLNNSDILDMVIVRLKEWDPEGKELSRSDNTLKYYNKNEDMLCTYFISQGNLGMVQELNEINA